MPSDTSKLRILLSLCLCIAFTLSMVLALISKFDSHPDEIHHLAAALYYKDHILPPVIGDPAVRDSYSVWGNSYLNYQWAEYFFAGKFALLVSPVVDDPRLGTRLFQVFLFLTLSILFIYRMRGQEEPPLILGSFLLVTPQIWYVFGYSNNDAFALAVSMLVAYQLAYPQSFFHGYMNSGRSAGSPAGGIVFGLLAGLLLICKPNYWVILLFAAAWTLLKFGIDRRIIRKYGVVMAIALSVLAFRVGMDLHVNGETNFAGASYINYFFGGFESKPSRLLEYQEEITPYEFRPSTIERDLAASRPDIKMRAKGVSAYEMLSQWRWHIVSFQSFTGVYGYMNIFGPNWYYRVMLLLYFLFAAYLCAALLRSGERPAISSLLLVAACCIASIFFSFFLSWNYAFQAQGRYLFPIIPMLGVLVYSNRQHLSGRLVNGFTLLCFVLSVWSFIFVGLARINAG